MSSAAQLADSIAESISESTDPRVELVALGMVVSGVICETRPESRAELVETFCTILRQSVAQATLN